MQFNHSCIKGVPRHSELQQIKRDTQNNDTQHNVFYYAECLYDECRICYCRKVALNAECNYTECRYAECRSAIKCFIMGVRFISSIEMSKCKKI